MCEKKNIHSHVLVRSKKIPRNVWWFDGHARQTSYIWGGAINIIDSKWLNRNQNKEGSEVKYSKSVSRWVTKWIIPLNLVDWWDERWRRDVIVMRLHNILYPHLRCQISETILPGRCSHHFYSSPIRYQVHCYWWLPKIMYCVPESKNLCCLLSIACTRKARRLIEAFTIAAGKGVSVL